MNDIRIGIPIIGGSAWMGGVSYVENLTKAISYCSKNQKVKLYLIVKNETLATFHLHAHFLSLFTGVIFLGSITTEVKTILNNFIHCKDDEELYQVINFQFPFFTTQPNKCFAAWIPDFQHKYLPNLFSEQEIAFRDRHFSEIAKYSKVVVLSSKDVEKDFKMFYPNSNCLTRVLHFHSIPNQDWYRINPKEVQKKYNLPDKFIICCNQFWKHKNHELLFNAISKLKEAGIIINLVCTGYKNDYRFNNYFSYLESTIQKNNIQDLIHIVGLIPRSDQIQLIRRSQFLVQPSLFEGWSTVVEDARALGKTICLSDLNVHYEQSPRHSVYFQRNNLNDLINKISFLLKDSEPGPNLNRENIARVESLKRIENYGNTFLKIANEAINIYK